MRLRNSCRVITGRLMEIDVSSGYQSPGGVDAMIAMIQSTFAAASPEQKFVVVADWRECSVFTPEVAARATQMLRVTSPRIERSAIMHLPDQHTAVLQLLRLVKEAEHEARRVFTDRLKLIAWLDETLTPEEQKRLRSFMAG